METQLQKGKKKVGAEDSLIKAVAARIILFS